MPVVRACGHLLRVVAARGLNVAAEVMVHIQGSDRRLSNIPVDEYLHSFLRQPANPAAVQAARAGLHVRCAASENGPADPDGWFVHVNVDVLTDQHQLLEIALALGARIENI